MGSSSTMWDHSYCRVPSKQTECDSRLGVKKQFRLLGMEVSSPVISEDLPTEGNPRDRLFASRFSRQIKTYFSWSQDPLSQAADFFQQNWFHKSIYAFPPFCMISKVLSKVLKDKVPMMILVTPAWPSQLWYPEAMRMSIQQPILLTWRRDFLKNPKREIHPLVQNKTLNLLAWAISGLDYKRITKGKWAGWCADRKINPFCSNIN